MVRKRWQDMERKMLRFWHANDHETDPRKLNQNDRWVCHQFCDRFCRLRRRRNVVRRLHQQYRRRKG